MSGPVTLQGLEAPEGRTADAPASAGAPPPASALPCLQVTTPPNTPAAPDSWEDELKSRIGILSGSARRSAYALQVDAEAIVEAWGVNNTVFITLTFGGGGDGPTVAKAQRCFDSFLTHSLGKLFTGGIKVLERGAKRGRVHFHLLADAGADVRTGVDFEALARGDRRTFRPHLRHLLASLRTAGQRYGFGRICECDPIKSTREGIARYVCKYISKHFEQRQTRDKGARLRSYWGTARPRRVVKSCRFSWAGEKGERGWLWRAKLARISALNGMKDSDAWKLRFGPRWAYHIAGYVDAWPLNFYPTKAHAAKDKFHLPKEIPETACDIAITRDTAAQVAVIYGKTLCFLVEKFPW